MIITGNSEEEQQNPNILINVLQREINDLKNTIDNIQSADNGHDVPQEIQINATNKCLRKQEMRQLQDKLRVMEESNAELKCEIDHLKLEAHVNAAIDDLRKQEIGELRNKVHRFKNPKVMRSSEVHLLREEMRVIVTTNDFQKQQIRELRDHVHELEETKAASLRKISQLKNKLEEANSTWQTEVIQLKHELEGANATFNQLKELALAIDPSSFNPATSLPPTQQPSWVATTKITNVVYRLGINCCSGIRKNISMKTQNTEVQGKTTATDSFRRACSSSGSFEGGVLRHSPMVVFYSLIIVLIGSWVSVSETSFPHRFANYLEPSVVKQYSEDRIQYDDFMDKLGYDGKICPDVKKLANTTCIGYTNNFDRAPPADAECSRKVPPRMECNAGKVLEHPVDDSANYAPKKRFDSNDDHNDQGLSNMSNPKQSSGVSSTDDEGSDPERIETVLTRFIRYDSTMKKLRDQLRIGENSNSGTGIAMSYGGTRVAIINPILNCVKIFDSDMRSNIWRQIGQAIEVGTSREGSPWNIDMTMDGLAMAIAAPLSNEGELNEGHIKVYHLNNSFGENMWIEIDHHSIRGKNEFESIGLYSLQINALDGSRVLFSAGRSALNTVTRVYQYVPDAVNPWRQMGRDIESPYIRSSAISGDGSRISISSSSTSSTFDKVQVFDFDAKFHEWQEACDPIMIDTLDGDIGHCIIMSSDGNILVIGANSPKCSRTVDDMDFHWGDHIRGTVEIRIYNEAKRQFKKIVPEYPSPYDDKAITGLPHVLEDSIIFGLQFFMGFNASMLSISGYNVNENYNFAKVYEWSLGA